MHKKDYDHLFRQLYNLQVNAPCHNGECASYQTCEYGVNDNCYGKKCAIDIVRDEAFRRYIEVDNYV